MMSECKDPVRCRCHDNVIVEDAEISLVDLARVIWQRKAYIFAIVALSIFGASFYLLSTPDIFKTEAVILPLQGRNTISLPSNLLGIEGLKEMIGESMPGMLEAPNSSKIRSILTSRRLNLLLVEKFDLLPILFADQWDKSRQRWRGEENNNKYFGALIHGSEKLFGANLDSLIKPPSPLDGSQLLQQKISVTTNKKNSNLVVIEFEDTDPGFAFLMTTRYIEALDDYLRSEAITRANDSKNYISVLKQAQPNEQTMKRLEELSLAFAEQELFAKMKSSFLFEVIDPPIQPERPFKPKRSQILVLTILASLLFGTLLAFAVEAIATARHKARDRVIAGDTPPAAGVSS